MFFFFFLLNTSQKQTFLWLICVSSLRADALQIKRLTTECCFLKEICCSYEKRNHGSKSESSRCLCLASNLLLQSNFIPHPKLGTIFKILQMRGEGNIEPTSLEFQCRRWKKYIIMQLVPACFPVCKRQKKRREGGGVGVLYKRLDSNFMPKKQCRSYVHAPYVDVWVWERVVHSPLFISETGHSPACEYECVCKHAERAW